MSNTIYNALFTFIFFSIVIGWVMNIFKLVTSGPVGLWEGLEIMRVLGIFIFPLGAVLGWV